MSVEKPLDLSKVSVANLLNDDAPANAAVLNETEIGRAHV